MTDYDNNNRGAIWDNKNRRGDRDPKYSGSAMVDGVEYWVAAWPGKRDQNQKDPVMKFTFRAKEERKSSNQEPKAAPDASFDDDDIPF